MPLKYTSDGWVSSDPHNLSLSRALPEVPYQFHGHLYLTVSHLVSCAELIHITFSPLKCLRIVKDKCRVLNPSENIWWNTKLQQLWTSVYRCCPCFVVIRFMSFSIGQKDDTTCDFLLYGRGIKFCRLSGNHWWWNLTKFLLLLWMRRDCFFCPTVNHEKNKRSE